MFALLALAFALAMDAFAVSLVRAATSPREWIRALEIGAAFGLAQGLMPLIGWAATEALGAWFKAVDHWIAFVLLSYLGWKLLKEALSADDRAGVGQHSRRLGLLIAAFATSIDAAAAGITLPLFGFYLPVACLVIGVTTGALCAIGYLTVLSIGARAARSAWASRAAEIAGGIILIILGLRILITHLLE